VLFSSPAVHPFFFSFPIISMISESPSSELFPSGLSTFMSTHVQSITTRETVPPLSFLPFTVFPPLSRSLARDFEERLLFSPTITSYTPLFPLLTPESPAHPFFRPSDSLIAPSLLRPGCTFSDNVLFTSLTPRNRNPTEKTTHIFFFSFLPLAESSPNLNYPPFFPVSLSLRLIAPRSNTSTPSLFCPPPKSPLFGNYTYKGLPYFFPFR